MVPDLSAKDLSVSSAYQALALQTTCVSVSQAQDREQSRSIMMKAVARVEKQVLASQAFIGTDCRLVVLPEYFLTGFPMGDSISAWMDKACVTMDGEEIEMLSELAQKAGVFLAGNAYEVDDHFSNLYFQTCFVMSPSGNVILRYRRLNSLFAPTPHDVWEAYLDRYGLDGVFPVARTEIGNLAALASEEILFPEVARCMVLRGAEILIHPTSQANELARQVKDAATITRAVENMAYVVSANSAGIEGTDLPGASAGGGSKIVDYRGLVLAMSGPGESMTAHAEIDLRALRRFRRRPGMENLLSRQRFEAYAASYSHSHFYPANTMVKGISNRQEIFRNQMETIERLSRLGII
jgi:predicted amidohydrolase